ncbi:hypothetical protein [Deinococcus alpinitundrae]|uniref:hypothetical protein n=1 Tax=Deinococcus alpinitundrae TaxID=468913 RepID=UPI00137ABF09|nr:hypothetical protein [Deinococcus alpinitundrae]
MSEQHLVLPEATLQAILALQEQKIIVSDRDVGVVVIQEGDSNVVFLNVQMTPPLFRLNKYLDLVYRTLESTSTKTFTISVEITMHEPLGWEET